MLAGLGNGGRSQLEPVKKESRMNRQLGLLSVCNAKNTLFKLVPLLLLLSTLFTHNALFAKAFGGDPEEGEPSIVVTESLSVNDYNYQLPINHYVSNRPDPIVFNTPERILNLKILKLKKSAVLF